MTPPAPTTQEIRKLCDGILSDPVLFHEHSRVLARWCLDRLDEQPEDTAPLHKRIANLEGSLSNISTKVLTESAAVFAMWSEGVTSIDKPKLEVMARRADSGSAFFATVILQVLASIEAGHMKNVSPEQIVVRRKL